jgi:hypothetical protein
LSDSYDDILRELRDRMRRVETRLTKFLQSQGFDTMSQQPLWKDGVVDVPSMSCSIKDVMSVIPGDWDSDIAIVHKRQPMMVWSQWEDDVLLESQPVTRVED